MEYFTETKYIYLFSVLNQGNRIILKFPCYDLKLIKEFGEKPKYIGRYPMRVKFRGNSESATLEYEQGNVEHVSKQQMNKVRNILSC